jgi:ABC-type sugar transport system permease subunit
MSIDTSVQDKPPRGGLGSITLGSVVLRLLALMFFWAGGSWLMFNMWADGYWQLAAIILFITFIITIIWLRPEAYPLRWMSPGLAIMILISVYPILYTVYISFTNYGTGNLLPKVQTIDILEQRQYLPEAGSEYEFILYQNPYGEYALLLRPEADSDAEPIAVVPGRTVTLSRAGAIIQEVEPAENIIVVGEDDPYSLVPRRQLLTALTELQDVEFGSGETAVRIQGMDTAAGLKQRYIYDETADTMFDNKEEVLYQADNEQGAFFSADGRELIPGFTVNIGLANYSRFLTDPSFRGPLILIFIWTMVYALLATILSFSLGLLIAIAFGRGMPGQKIIKSLLIIPFAIPNVISILVWRGLWNPLTGPVATTLSGIVGQTVNVFASPIGVKIALLSITLWLAYPYYVLINSGALQAIPQDMYEAADIDGANWWHKFRHLTLPLLLVGVGPLLIGTFMVNFNSFNVIYLFNNGGPPMVGTSTPAGHSDILISYVYRLAFGGGGGQDLGYATAITVIIFFLLVAVTLFQYRYMRVWEEVGESV